MDQREIIEPVDFDEAAAASFERPIRIVLPNPRRGGPSLSKVRAAFGPKGRIRITGTKARIFVDLDPGEPEASLIGLDMIARSDPNGLERAILSALGEVDEIVVGIDGRSDEATRKVAEAYADTVFTFGAFEIGLSDADWQADKIHFSNARNLGRSKLKAPWALVIDTDEYIQQTDPLRDKVRETSMDGFTARVIGREGVEHRDGHRLARSRHKWWGATHNQISLSSTEHIDLVIVHDTGLRAREEVSRRETQRNDGIALLEKEAAEGQLTALFHLAKHKLTLDVDAEHEQEHLDACAQLVQDYRFRAEPHGVLAEDRAWLAIIMALRYYDVDNFEQAEVWAIRVMLDGPRIEAMCLIGDIAEDRGDLELAWRWYEAACATPDASKLKLTAMSELRWGRLGGLRRALGRTGPHDVPPPSSNGAPEHPTPDWRPRPTP